jgi:hypothetical protein
MDGSSGRQPTGEEDVSLASTREENGAGDELRQLKAIVAEQQRRLDALESHQDSPAGADTNERRSTRRQMLKLAGATLVGAAGSAALRAIPAAAADGDTMTVGTVFTETLGNATGVSASTASYNTAGYFYGGSNGRGLTGRAATNGVGVEGTVTAPNGIGVVGYGTTVGTYTVGLNTGVFAIGQNVGVFAIAGTAATTGVGVSGMGFTGVAAYTSSTGSRALYAYTSATNAVAIEAKATGIGLPIVPTVAALSTTGIGLVAYGYTGGIWAANVGFGAAIRAGNFSKAGGPDLKLGGTGRLLQIPTVTGGVGAPNYTPGTYMESVRAYDGALWISRAYGAGTVKAAWKRVNAVRVDSSDGSGTPYSPYRVYDSRSGAKKAAGTTTVIPIAGLGAGAQNIPLDAVAIIGNLTATQYTGTGFLAISPAGVSVGTSTVNFITGQAAIANSFIVGLGTGSNAGKVQVKVAGHASHFIIDVTGYMQ